MKKEFPIVSVIMCVHNTKEDFLLEAVNSILGQTLSDLELIIIDDASTNDLFTNDVFKDERIKILKESINHGPAYCRNIGIRNSCGKYIAIMDSDDVALPNRLEAQVNFLEKNDEYVACGTWFKFIGEKDHEVKRLIDDNDYYRCSLLFGNVPTILNPSVMIKKIILSFNGISFDEQLIYGEDYKMFVQLTEIGKITNIKEVLMHYRVHNSQLTKGNQKHKKSFRYDSAVKGYILNKLKLQLNKSENRAFLAKKGLKHVNPIVYRSVLDKIIDANCISHYYENESLKKRVSEQWKNVIYSINNPFKWMHILFSLKHYKKEAFRIKYMQIKNKIKR